MSDLCKDIHDFSSRFGLPQLEIPGFMNDRDMIFRLKFLTEELQETIEAYEEGDLEQFFDGLIDLVYVAIGTAWLCNLNFVEGWNRVHAANMQKVRVENDGNDPRSKRKHHFDVVKPEGWQPPVLRDLL